MKNHLQKAALTLGLILSLVSFAQDKNVLPAKKDGFFWGVANSAFQVEGEPIDSDWLRWTQTTGKIADGTNADEASRFWKRYDEDFKLAKELGSNAFRISIAWERIEPRKGEWDEKALQHYEDIIRAMRDRGLEPIVTLHHFTLPGWLTDTGGLLSSDFVPEFTAYAKKVVTRLSTPPANVTYWMTFNEPMILVNAAYLAGEWPPGHKDDSKGCIEAAAQLARAHISSVREIRALKNPAIKISIAKHWRPFEAKGGPIDWITAKMTDWVFNRQMMTALTTGKLLFWMPGANLVRETIDLPEGRSTLDYLGINYYGRSVISFVMKAPFIKNEEGSGPRNDLNWEIYPEGLYKTLMDVKQYNLPIVISENGIADASDKNRAQFLKDHLFQMNRAIQEGALVRGYLHWSLTDNFEWAKGLAPRFGLVEIDYKTGERKPRPSFQVYKSLIH